MTNKPRRREKAEAGQVKEEQDTLSFEYIKSNFFRVVHADGAIGSMSATGNLHVAFYSERSAIPKVTVHRHNDDGTLGEMLPEETIRKDTIIREIDIDIVFDGDTLDSLIDFFQQQKQMLEDRTSQARNTSKRGKKNVRH